MSEKPLNKGPHDIGGEEAGPVDTADHGTNRFGRGRPAACARSPSGRQIVADRRASRRAPDLG